MGDSRELTPKQEAYCKAYMQTGIKSEAYRQAYNANNMKPESIHVAAHMVHANDKVAIRLEEMKARQMKKHHVTLDSLTLQLEETRTYAMKDGKYSAAVSSIMGIARLHGLDVQRTQVAIRHETSPQERVTMLQALFARASVPDKKSGCRAVK